VWGAVSTPERILITGGAGFIGSHLADALVDRGRDVTLLDDLSTGSFENLGRALRSSAVEFIEGSVLDADLVERCMCSVDACVHLAGAVGVKLILADPLSALLANVRGTDVVLAAAASRRCRLVFASSSEVYGKVEATEISENADLCTGSPWQSRWSYSIAKQFGEAASHAYARAGLEMLAVRPFNTVGPRQAGAYGMVLPRFVRQALADEPLTVYGDGTQSRCFTSVHDVTSAIIGLLACAAARGVYNIGSSAPVEILELARRVIQRSGSGSQIHFLPYAQAYGDGFAELGRRVPDTTRLRNEIGWLPEHTLGETIDEMIVAQSAADANDRRPPAAPIR
jgi:UDP-glucose 4-epimerase